LFDQVFPEHVAFLQQRLSGLTDDELNTLRAGLAAVRQQFALIIYLFSPIMDDSLKE